MIPHAATIYLSRANAKITLFRFRNSLSYGENREAGIPLLLRLLTRVGRVEVFCRVGLFGFDGSSYVFPSSRIIGKSNCTFLGFFGIVPVGVFVGSGMGFCPVGLSGVGKSMFLLRSLK